MKKHYVNCEYISKGKKSSKPFIGKLFDLFLTGWEFKAAKFFVAQLTWFFPLY